MAKHRSATKKRKADYLQDIYGEDANLDQLDDYNLVKTPQGNAYAIDPMRGLSPKQKMIADLAACGVSKSDISRKLSKNGTAKSVSHICNLLRNPLMQERVQQSNTDLVGEAKEKIRSVVAVAADHVVNAVERGDLKECHFVLAANGITEKKEQTSNVHVDFGSWLSSGFNTKGMHQISNSPKEIDITADSSSIEVEVEGNRL